MESSKFDELTKALATATSRRQALKTIVATTFGSILGLGGIGTAFAKCHDAGHNCDENSTCCSKLCCNGKCCASGQICSNGTCVAPTTTTTTTTTTSTTTLPPGATFNCVCNNAGSGGGTFCQSLACTPDNLNAFCSSQCQNNGGNSGASTCVSFC